jgi:hypothetical protein
MVVSPLDATTSGRIERTAPAVGRRSSRGTHEISIPGRGGSVVAAARRSRATACNPARRSGGHRHARTTDAGSDPAFNHGDQPHDDRGAAGHEPRRAARPPGRHRVRAQWWCGQPGVAVRARRELQPGAAADRWCARELGDQRCGGRRHLGRLDRADRDRARQPLEPVWLGGDRRRGADLHSRRNAGQPAVGRRRRRRQPCAVGGERAGVGRNAPGRECVSAREWRLLGDRSGAGGAGSVCARSQRGHRSQSPSQRLVAAGRRCRALQLGRLALGQRQHDRLRQHVGRPGRDTRGTLDAIGHACVRSDGLVAAMEHAARARAGARRVAQSLERGRLVPERRVLRAQSFAAARCAMATG